MGETIANVVNPIVEGLVNSLGWLVDKINSAFAAAKKFTGLSAGGIVPASFADGGVVYAQGGFQPLGTDTVPAMLTPGERVLTVAENRAFEGGLMGGVTININNTQVLSDDDIVEKIGDPILTVLKQHFATV